MKDNSKAKNKVRILALALVVLVAVLAVMLFSMKDKEKITLGDDKATMKEVAFDLGEEILVTKVGKYSGTYMEDGSDEEVSNVMSIMITNKGEQTLQYAEVTLSGEAEDAVFQVTTLKPNESMLVLESARKEYSKDYTEASMKNFVFFEDDLNTYDDLFEIQPLDGGFNITNISSKDIDDEIMIYFKDKIDGIYYGGITYRGRIEGGLKSGEIRQIMTDNFSEENTEVMFITMIER